MVVNVTKISLRIWKTKACWAQKTILQNKKNGFIIITKSIFCNEEYEEILEL